MRTLAWWIVCGVVWTVMAGAVRAGPPENLDFERAADGDKGGVPGWFVPGVCAQGGWVAEVVDKGAAQGERCAVLRQEGEGQAAPFGNLMQSFDAKPYAGKRITVRARAKLGEQATGRVQCWVRVDRAGQQRGFFDNCADRPITEREWKQVVITGDVDDDAVAISFGMMVIGGKGPACLDDVRIEAKEKPATRADGPREPTERGLANLLALTRAIGYVRHYCPSDEAAKADWDRLTVDAVLSVEPASTADELAGALGRVFAPVAPAAVFQTTAFTGDFDPKSMLGPDDRPTHTVAWKHRGFGPDGPKPGAIYVSRRVETEVDAKPEAGMPQIRATVTRACELPGPGHVWMRVPIVLYKDADGTLPRPKIGRATPDDAPDLTGDDRATRLAAVILAWNVLEHFFPYFDVVHDDWDAALVEAIKSAATDPDGVAFGHTLERLTAHLHDGHGNVSMRQWPTYFSLPLVVTFVGDEPVVLNAIEGAVVKGVLPGDAIVSVGGRPVGELLADARKHEPAATDGWFKARATRRLIRRETAEPVEVVLRSPEGKEKTVSLKPVSPDKLPPERSGPVLSEPTPGIWYVDLDRATDKDLAAAMKDLAKAKGVVFDMRGYPNQFNMGMLGHLSDERLLCARWEIPLANWPDREHVEWDHARWDLPPVKPRIKGRVAFITDGRAISAAETFMGIVENYKLGEIVGEPTAGTNGNVNTIKLPGGYGITFTGMKVLKHDGSQHHGIGIRPTIEVHRTIAGIAAGKDEMLEKALEVVGAPETE